MWDRWMQEPGATENLARYKELVERGGTREFWILGK
jgi:hypothetical protein